MIKDFIEKIIREELYSMSYELVDFQMNTLKTKTILRIFIDKLNEKNSKCLISVADCELVSKALEKIIEQENYKENLVLEVSSPGIERNLNNINDFIRFNGFLAAVYLNEKTENLDSFFIANIESVKDNIINFKTKDKEFSIDYAKIKKAKLKYER